MHAWPASEVPALPGQGRDLRIHDTATGGPVTLDPGPVARIYVCGITPYDATHMGHAATYNAFDLVQRVWLDTKRQVHYVQNVTDVDDPLLERAVRDGVDWTALAEQETALFREDMTALRMLPPQHYIGAVEAIPGIVPIVERLRDAGAAYELDGDTYFSVEADPHFGGVSHLDAAAMRLLSAERGGDPKPAPARRTRSTRCCGWPPARASPAGTAARLAADTPAGTSSAWPSPSTTSAWASTSRAAVPTSPSRTTRWAPHTPRPSPDFSPMAKAYVHAGMDGLDGEKMSKSKGNLVFVSQLRREGVDPAAIRLTLLAHHYRSDWEWTDKVLEDAVARLDRWRAAVSRPDSPPAEALVEQIREALANDLDSPAALKAVDRWAALQQETGGTDPGAPGVVSRAVDALLGVAL
ncbi:L-cysteine:1D-myo-inositol 2-amino-2-deoxy-alpha-D-glucopyranoside ligase OS=Streptomyces tendae OX=1932 GN=mshC PE=3 SV=1 [Streptomyces tendae]